jgi:hypothetical protein
VGGFRDCIVVFLDLIDIKKWASKRDPKASSLMGSFHETVRREMAQGLKAIHHAYVWNDSMILLAYVDGRPDTDKKVLRAANNLKRIVDISTPSYAIAVKGQAFPSQVDSHDSRVTVIKASSWAMANCFQIEAAAKKIKRRPDWYIDSRIAKNVGAAKSPRWLSVDLLPKGKSRRVYLHSGYLWNDADVDLAEVTEKK